MEINKFLKDLADILILLVIIAWGITLFKYGILNIFIVRAATGDSFNIAYYWNDMHVMEWSIPLH